MKAIPEYCDLMELSEFQECVNCGDFIPDDGIGYYATSDRMSDLSVWSNQRIPPEWATHVAWFNR